MENENTHPFVGKYVIVRSSPSGVHCGKLKEYCETSNHFILENSRRIHYWEKVFTLSGIAMDGLDNKSIETRVSMEVDEISIGYVCEVIPCTEKATENLKKYRTQL